MEMSPIREGKTAAGEPANQPLDLKSPADAPRPDRSAASAPAASGEAASRPAGLKPTEQALRDRLPSDEAFIQALERVGASLAELRADIFPEPGKPAPERSLPDPEVSEMRHEMTKSGWAATGEDDRDTRPAGIHYEDYNIVPPPPPEAMRRRSVFVPVVVMLLSVGAAATAFLLFRDGQLKTAVNAVNPMLQRAGIAELHPAGPATTGATLGATTGAATTGAATVQAARAADLPVPPKPEVKLAPSPDRVEPRMAPPAAAKPASEPFTQAFRDFQPATPKPAPQGEIVTAALPPAAPVAAPSAPAAIAAPPPGTARSTVEAPAPGAPAVAEPPKSLYSAAEVDQLRDRAEAYVKRGQIANARSVLDALHRQGDARSTFILATTYDPVVLQAWSVVGISADPAKARALYGQAAKAGIQGAAAGLARLQDQ
jgi:hypothetical protein